MCQLSFPKPIKLKYCYKVYNRINGMLFTVFVDQRHILGKRYKATNVKYRHLKNKILTERFCEAGKRHSYDETQVGFMGYTKYETALYKHKNSPGDIVVKCLMENARIDTNGFMVDCQYLTPLKIVKE